MVMFMSGEQREKWIDLVKCIAIFVVMVNHSQLAAPHLRFWGGMFFVPVFFVLSGFTYRIREESFLTFCGRKAKRLLLPYITANGILFVFFLVKDILSGQVTPVKKLLDVIGIFYARNQMFVTEPKVLFPPAAEGNIYFYELLNSPTWFLPALFLTMVLFEILVRISKRDGRKMLLGAVILLCMANLWHYLFPLLLPWSLDAVPYFLIMFLWGYFMKRKQFLDYFDRKKWILLLLFVGFLVCALINGSANYSVADYGRSTMLALYNALVSSTTLMYLIRRTEKYIPGIFTQIGRQTLFLLCYHLFVFAMLETVFPGVHPLLVIFVTMVLLTVVAWGKERMIYAKKQRH